MGESIEKAIARSVRLAEFESEIHDLRAQLAQAIQERDELRADLVWAVREANSLDFWSDWEFSWTSINDVTYAHRHDGTDTDLCRAIREARRGD